MSKRSRTRFGHSNPTIERRRRTIKSWPFTSIYTKKMELRDDKLFAAIDALRLDYNFKGIEKVAKLCPNVTQAKCYQTTGISTIALIIKGKDGKAPGSGTIFYCGSCVKNGLPAGVTLRVVGSLSSKAFQTF
jgi:hypothetical protein